MSTGDVYIAANYDRRTLDVARAHVKEDGQIALVGETIEWDEDGKVTKHASFIGRPPSVPPPLLETR